MLMSLDKRIDNPDQRIASSIKEMTYEFTTVVFGSFKNVFSLLFTVRSSSINCKFNALLMADWTNLHLCWSALCLRCEFARACWNPYASLRLQALLRL